MEHGTDRFVKDGRESADSAETIMLEKKLTQDIATLSDSEKKRFTDNMQKFLDRADKPTLDGKSRMDEAAELVP
jgi:hypothetical protein